jgi:hypothetical protein
MLRLIWSAFRDAAWAPALVLLFRWEAFQLGIRRELDHVIHFSGGLAIAYFLYRVIRMASPWLGEVRPFTRHVLAFTAACTVAVFWEFAEYASDVFLGTHIQYSVAETLQDLIYGTLGAACCLGLIALFEACFKRRPRGEDAKAEAETSGI